MTNPPSYSKQSENLGKYTNTTPAELPAELSASARFVRASYNLKNLPKPDAKNQAQGFILSVLNSVGYPHRVS